VAVYYLDTSALVKRYAHEQGSAWLLALTDPGQRHDLYTVRLTAPELVAALFRKARTGNISTADAASAAQIFRLDWRHGYFVLDATGPVTERAMDLAATHGIRGYDAVHLAAALTMQDRRLAMNLAPLTFISADDDQRGVASIAGLLVDNPNAYP